MSIEEHLLPEEIVKYTSIKPVHFGKNPMKFSFYITNRRLLLCGKGHLVSEKLSDFDYFVYREKGRLIPKGYIRLWIGTKKIDLISERENTKQIYKELQKCIKQKLKKGGVVLTDMIPMLEKAFPNVDWIQALHSGGKIVLSVPQEILEKAPKGFIRMLEDEWNWNLEYLPNGEVRITIIPELPVTRTSITIIKENERG